MPNWSKLFRAGIYSVFILIGAASFAVETDDTLWLARTWQTDEGLPDNNITGIAQSADGYLWVATLGGLMRFDGVRFDEFSTVRLPKVPNRVVRNMYQDRRGNLWLTMDRGGLIRVGETAAKVFEADEGLTTFRAGAAAEDKEGGIWFVGVHEVCRIHGDKVERFGPEAPLPSGANIWLANDVHGELWFARGAQVGAFRDGAWKNMQTMDSSPVRFIAAHEGGLWICTTNKVFKYAEGQELQELARLPDRATVREMLEDHSGTLWIGTGEYGLLRLGENKLEPVPVSHPEISALMEDREGNLWVGTAGGGLNRLRPRAVGLTTMSSGLPFASVRSVCQDIEGWLWVTLQNGSLARGRGSQWRALTEADGWPGGDAQCAVPASSGGVWIGTHDRGLQLWNQGKTQEWKREQGLGSLNIRSLLAAKNGEVWVASDTPSRLHSVKDGQIRGLKMPEKGRAIRAFAEGADGTIWAGTSDGQILKVAGDEAIYESGAQDPGRTLSVRCLHTTPDGSLWIGYAGYGVGRWHKGTYTRIGRAKGLFDDYVSQMISDDQGGLWLTGNRGLFQVRLSDLVSVCEEQTTHLRSIAFGRNEGVPSLQPAFENSPKAWRGTDGQLWFATRNGLLGVQPEKIRENPVPPPVSLQDVKVDDHLVALYDSQMPLRIPAPTKLLELRSTNAALEVPPQHSKIEFAFTALSFNSPENVQFRYRLKNFDTEWVEAGVDRIAKYSRLSSGHYEFEVTACNEAGVWSNPGYQLALIVHPFLWQTWWFQLTVIGVFTAAIIGLVRYFSFRRLRLQLLQLEQAEVLHRERARIARDMHDEVGTKLSRLSLLSEMASHQPEMPAAARSEVAEISETARDTIRSFEEIVWAVNPKNDSLSQLMNYLCRFAEEFFEGSQTQCVFDVPDAIPDVKLSTDARHHLFLAAKEAFNNVFKHAGAHQVRMRLTLNPDGFEIAIEDDGRGFDGETVKPRPGAGSGLDNMRERMKLVGGEVELQHPPGLGTRVIFRVHSARIVSA